MRNLFLSLLVIMGLCACDKEIEDVKLYFIGDSMVANWDVSRFFPSRIVENRGKDGIGIKELSDQQISFPQDDFIVLVGTNDIKPSMTDEQLDAYVSQYTEVIGHLDAKQVFIISVLPTSNAEKNQMIQRFNKHIQKFFSNSSKIIFINCYDDFERAGVLKDELSRDGLHLNDYGYMLLTERVKERL